MRRLSKSDGGAALQQYEGLKGRQQKMDFAMKLKVDKTGGFTKLNETTSNKMQESKERFQKENCELWEVCKARHDNL